MILSVGGGDDVFSKKQFEMKQFLSFCVNEKIVGLFLVNLPSPPTELNSHSLRCSDVVSCKAVPKFGFTHVYGWWCVVASYTM